MSCERYAEAVVDHACGADLAPDAAAHLRSCAACSAMLAEHRAAIGALDGEIRNALAIEPSPYFVERVHAHVREAPPATLWWRWPLAAAAAIVILAIAGSFALRRGTPPPIVARTQPPAVAPAPSPATPSSPAVDMREVSQRHPGTRGTLSTPGTLSTLSTRGAPGTPGTLGTLSTPGTPGTLAPWHPEVLVPPDQARALGRYLTLVRTGQVDMSTLTAKVPGADLVVAPLAVDPLAVIPLEPETGDAADRRHEE